MNSIRGRKKSSVSWRKPVAEVASTMHDLERFIDGFQRFQRQYFERRTLYRDLSTGQHPSTAGHRAVATRA